MSIRTCKKNQEKMFIWPMILFSCLLIIMLAGCGGSSGGDSSDNDGGSGSGSGDTSIAALIMPERIELSRVENSDRNGSNHLFKRSFSSRAFDDAGTAYTNQEKESWVEDTQALDMVNDILGACSDTGYEYFVNAGPYVALVKKIDDDQQSQGGESTTSNTTQELQEMIVEVSRASTDDPMIIKIWTKESDGPGGQDMLIRGYFTVTQGVSAEYPYGVMEAHFKGMILNDAGQEISDTPLFTMAIKVSAQDGNVIVENIDDCVEDDWESHTKAKLIADATLSNGNGFIYMSESDWENPGIPDISTAYFAYNEDYFKIQEVNIDGSLNGNEKVYSKDQLLHRIYRYKIFDENGAIVERNSGFPIRFADGTHAYIGYYGMWMNQQQNIESGVTRVTREDTEEEYTVVQTQGKLTKHTKAELTLADLNNVTLSYWSCVEEGGDCYDLLITWNGNDFIAIGQRDNETGSVEFFEDVDRVVEFEEWDGAWCPALNAYLHLGILYQNGATPDNNTVLYYHKESTVFPGSEIFPDADLTLYHFGIEPGSGDPVEAVYTFDISEMVLKNADGNSVVFDAQGDGEYLMPLTTASQADTIAAWEQDVYYCWTSGNNEWNRLTTLQDASGNYVTFDAPLQLGYTHETGNDINFTLDDPNNDKNFNLEWDGFDLMIPWEFDEENDDWQPLINLNDSDDGGPTLTDLAGTDYYLKWIEEGLRMIEVDSSVALGLTVDLTIQEPTLEYDAAKTALVGDLPENAELKVIKGVLISEE